MHGSTKGSLLIGNSFIHERKTHNNQRLQVAFILAYSQYLQLSQLLELPNLPIENISREAFLHCTSRGRNRRSRFQFPSPPYDRAIFANRLDFVAFHFWKAT